MRDDIKAPLESPVKETLHQDGTMAQDVILEAQVTQPPEPAHMVYDEGSFATQRARHQLGAARSHFADAADGLGMDLRRLKQAVVPALVVVGVTIGAGVIASIIMDRRTDDRRRGFWDRLFS